MLFRCSIHTFIFLIIVIPSVVFSEVLSGTVHDDQGIPLSGASVYLMRSMIGAYADAEGTFRLDAPSAGTDTLRCRLIGYTERVIQVSIPDSVSVVLSPEPVELDTITVFSEQPEDVPPHERTTASVTVIEREDIPERVLTLDTVLERDAGVDIRTYGAPGSRSEISIRGSTTEQVTVYLDGIPLTAGGSGISGLESIPVGQLDRIEVYRGAAPGTFGAGAIGGVVNISTIPTDETALITASTSYGSYGANHQSLSSRFNAGNGNYFAFSADRRAGENDFRYFDDRGTTYNTSDDGWETRKNADFESLSFSGSWQHRFDSAFISTSLFARSSERGVSGLGRRPALQARHELDNQRLQLRYEYPGLITLQGWISREQRAFYDPADEAGRRGRQDSDTDIGYHGIQAHIQHVFGPTLNHLRLELRRESYESRDAFEGSTTLPSRRIYFGIGYESDIMILGDAMWFEPRLHYERLDDEIQDVGWFIGTASDSLRGKQRDTSTTALGWRYRVLPQLMLRANAGSYRRAPDFNELFGDTGDVVGNSELVSEKSTNLDAGFHLNRGLFPFDVDATAFYRYTKDLIQHRQYGDFVISDNIGKAEVTGIETQLDGHYLWRKLAVRGSLAWQHALNKSDATAFKKDRYYDKYLPYHPIWQADTAIGIDLTSRIRGSWMLSYESKLYRGPSNLDEEMIPGRTIHDISFDVTLTDSATFNFDIENISDHRYVDRWGYPKPGRAWYVSISWSLR